jgi:hypothetical protein
MPALSHLTGLVTLSLAVAACAADAGREAARRDSVPPAVVGDSALPRSEALRRFQRGLPPVESLGGGASSADSLVRSFVRAVEHRDTAALRTLIISPAEFAYLFYPTTPQGLPPYDLAPALMWDLLERQTEAGIGTMLSRLGGKPMRMLDWSCGDSASVEGRNSVWGPCLIRHLRGPGDTVAERLTGPILERDGRFKFVSYTNDID